jgi:hypothetical protein
MYPGVNIEFSDHATSLFQELHKTFTTFIWPESTNQCTQEWYFAKQMMVSKIPSTE